MGLLKAVKQALYALIFYSGAYRPLTWIHRRFFGARVRILYGHGVVRRGHPAGDFLRFLEFMGQDEFERDLRFLRKRCVVLSLDEALESLRKGRVPDNAVVLTFDDGYKDNHDVILPLLEEHRLPAAIFLSAGLLDGAGEFWFNRLIECVYHTDRPEWKEGVPGEGFPLRTDREKASAIQALAVRLKDMPEPEKQAALDRLEAALCPQRDKSRPLLPMLSWEGARRLAASPWVTVGAHSLTHPILTRIPPEEAEREILGSLALIREKTGTEPRHFAYPNGRRVDYNDRIRNIVSGAGFLSSCSTEPGGNAPDGDPFALRREGFDPEPLHMFGLKVTGFFDLTADLKELARGRFLTEESRRALRDRVERSLPAGLFLRRGPADGRSVYLTFDDGPHPDHTPRLLDVLKKEGARATFFISGPNADARPDIVRRIASEGHVVASHSWFHRRRSHLDFTGVYGDIRRMEKLLERTCGPGPRLYRPPYGRVTLPLVFWAAVRGMTIALWSLDTDDDRSRSVDAVLANARRARPGDVLLLHDDSPAAVEALPALIRDARARGFGFGVLENGKGHGNG